MSTIELVSCISNCGRKRSTEADGFEVAGIDENGRVVWWCCLCAKKQAQSHGDLNKARVLWKEDKIKASSVTSKGQQDCVSDDDDSDDFFLPALRARPTTKVAGKVRSLKHLSLSSDSEDEICPPAVAGKGGYPRSRPVILSDSSDDDAIGQQNRKVPPGASLAGRNALSDSDSD